MTRVLVTGATGFVGRWLCRSLSESGFRIRAALRDDCRLPEHVAEKIVVGDIGPATDWSTALRDVDAVIHLAARVHVLDRSAVDSDLFHRTNVQGTGQLAAAAASAKVPRFVHLSSVKVNGEETDARAYAAADEPRPKDAYGISKWQAEQCLLGIAACTGLGVVIVRSPLVYGSGVGANFLRLMRWVDAGWPLPFGSINNARSLVSVWNLCDLLQHVLASTAAPGGTWMVSDGEDLSTPELIRSIAAAMDRRVRLVRVPAGVLQACGRLLGRGAELRRLCGSLVVDSSATRARLGWAPPLSTDECLRRTVLWYLSAGRSLAD